MHLVVLKLQGEAPEAPGAPLARNFFHPLNHLTTYFLLSKPLRNGNIEERAASGVPLQKQ